MVCHAGWIEIHINNRKKWNPGLAALFTPLALKYLGCNLKYMLCKPSLILTAENPNPTRAHSDVADHAASRLTDKATDGGED